MKLIPNFIYKRIAHRPNLLKIADNVGWLFVDKILRMGVGLIVGVWVARYLAPSGFGLYNFAIAFTSLFAIAGALGIKDIVIRDLVKDESDTEEIMGTAFFILIISGISAFLLSSGTIYLLDTENPLTEILVLIIGTTLLFRFSDIVLYWFESQVNSKYCVWAQNCVFLVFALVKIVLILLGKTLVWFAWAYAAEGIAISIFLLLIFRVAGPKTVSFSFNATRAKEMLHASWPLLISGLAVFTYMKIDQIMLGYMLDESTVGIYSAATRISEVWYFIPMSVAASVFPALMDAKKKSEAEYTTRMKQLFGFMVWTSLLFAIPMSFLSGFIVDLLYGEDYLGSGPVLSVHIWASIFVFLGVASNQWLIIENLQKLSMQRTLLGAIINIVLNLFLIPGMGAIGAAWATLLSQCFAALFFDLFQKKTRILFTMKISSFYYPTEFIIKR